jgi:hypothetical protein
MIYTHGINEHIGKKIRALERALPHIRDKRERVCAAFAVCEGVIAFTVQD